MVAGTTGGDGSGGATNGTDADYFSFTLAEGETVTSITVAQAAPAPGNGSFLGYVAGTAFAGQTEADIDAFVIFADGSEIVGAFPALGSGDHAFWIQEVAGEADYSLTFTVTAEDAPAGPADGDVVLLQSESGRYLDADGPGVRSFPNVNSSRIARADDRWQLNQLDNGYWVIESEMFGLYLDADNAAQEWDVNLGPADNRGIVWELSLIHI